MFRFTKKPSSGIQISTQLKITHLVKSRYVEVVQDVVSVMAAYCNCNKTIYMEYVNDVRNFLITYSIYIVLLHSHKSRQFTPHHYTSHHLFTLNLHLNSLANFSYVVPPTAQSLKKLKNVSPVRAIINCDVWLLQISVVRGTLLGLQYMGEDEGGKGGVVVNMASIAGLEANEAFPVYAATKHAVIGLTRSFGVSTACSNVDIQY